MNEFIWSILPYLAWFACGCLFTVPAIWGGFFTFSLLGHATHYVPGGTED